MVNTDVVNAQFYNFFQFFSSHMRSQFDHVFIGNYDADVRPNHLEVANFVYQSIEEVEVNLQSYPEKYTVWFKIAFPKVVAWYQSNSLLS